MFSKSQEILIQSTVHACVHLFISVLQHNEHIKQEMIHLNIDDFDWYVYLNSYMDLDSNTVFRVKDRPISEKLQSYNGGGLIQELTLQINFFLIKRN